MSNPLFSVWSLGPTVPSRHPFVGLRPWAWFSVNFFILETQLFALGNSLELRKQFPFFISSIFSLFSCFISYTNNDSVFFPNFSYLFAYFFIFIFLLVRYEFLWFGYLFFLVYVVFKFRLEHFLEFLSLHFVDKICWTPEGVNDNVCCTPWIVFLVIPLAWFCYCRAVVGF